MCGIAGIVIPNRSSVRLDRALAERMRDVIAHRGPDGVGLYLTDRVALGHRRLAIVDVEHGAQPMASDDGRIQLIYNGEIYNHPELSRQLQSEGVRYHTHCDTETILRLYERHGADLPSHLRGMFAIAIWDARTESLLLVRDRFGVKPVYYAHLDDGTLLFGSEIKAILASGLVRASMNAAALPDMLANHAPSGDETMFEGIRRLPPGHTLTWRDGRVVIAPYWDLHYGATDERADDVIVADYRERFIEAVRMRLMADVPLGMFLSGGIDSAAITAAMSTLVTDPIKTFSVAFAEREANELSYARMIAERYRTDHHEVVVSPGEFWQAVPSLVWHEDEPMAHPSSVALNFVSRLAVKHVKVVLTGEGSDETLAGYNRYRVTIFNRTLGTLVPAPVRALARTAVGALPVASRVRQRVSRTSLVLPADLTTLYFDNFAVFPRQQQPGLLSAAMRERVAGIDPYAAAQAALDRTDARTLLDQLLYADTKTYLHELLMKQDQMSMAASIESRVPFLDHPLVEFASTLPMRLKLRGWTTKYVLRQAMKDMLPPEILSRKKMGFPVPVGAWLRGSWQPLVNEFVLSPRVAARGIFDAGTLALIAAAHQRGANNGQRLWSLINFEIWQRIFMDGEAPGDIRMPAA
ncbi:MAG: asparagine synthase (glutamine-hydrolyzing) [Gemmatimonadaceae bacterium]|nr:asparagine synthase (glutamine-hydrolyzing) [Gemmatimonadaceae bacterium]